jgi:hypothetical protein
VFHFLEDVPDVHADKAKQDHQYSADDQNHEHQRTPARREVGSAPGDLEGKHVRHFDCRKTEKHPAQTQAEVKRHQRK